MSDGRPPIHDINRTEGLIGLGPIPGFSPVAAFNVDQVRDLIRTKGIRAWHFKHALDPASESVETGSRVDLQAANLGLRYYCVRELVVVPQAFKLEHQLQVQGLYDVESVILNVSGNYIDGDCGQVFVSPRDIIMLNSSITLEVRQKIEYNPVEAISLKYKIKGVSVLFSETTTFIQDQDYCVVNGKIMWLKDGRRPQFVNGKGQILSIVYWATPFYIVSAVPHVLRILPSNEEGLGGLPRHAELRTSSTRGQA